MSYKFDRLFEKDFLRVPRPLVRKFGLNTAIMFSELYSEYSYYREHEMLQNSTFYSTIENIFNNTGLTKYQQSVACKILQDNNLITVMYHDLPRKRYFKFNLPKVNQLYDELEPTQTTYYDSLKRPKFDNNEIPDKNSTNIETPHTTNSMTRIDEYCKTRIINCTPFEGVSF